MEKIDDNICLTLYVDPYSYRVFPFIPDVLQC